MGCFYWQWLKLLVECAGYSYLLVLSIGYNYTRLLVIITENLNDYFANGYFNFCNGVSELQMKLPSFLGYINTFVFTVCVYMYSAQ